MKKDNIRKHLNESKFKAEEEMKRIRLLFKKINL